MELSGTTFNSLASLLRRVLPHSHFGAPIISVTTAVVPLGIAFLVIMVSVNPSYNSTGSVSVLSAMAELRVILLTVTAIIC